MGLPAEAAVMPDRDRGGIEDSEVEIPDVGTDPVDPEAAAEGETLRLRLRHGRAALFSLETFLVVLALAIAGAFLVGRLLPLGDLATLVGILTAAFLHAAVAEGRHYLEAAVAGAAVGGIWTVFGNLVGVVLGVGVPVVALAVAGGGIAGAAGHYFGRDLRHGLTREL